MSNYVDGFVLPVPKKKLGAYRRLARTASKVWRSNGALEYRECLGDDLDMKFGANLRRDLKLQPSEAAVFAWIVYKSRAHRDRVNAKVMKDPRMAPLMKMKKMPFDLARVLGGGFTVMVDA